MSGITAPGHESALVLARWYSEPLAVVDIPLRDGTADAGQVARALWLSVGQQVKARCSAAGMPTTAPPVLVAAGRAGTGGISAARDARPRYGPQALRDGGLRLPWPPPYLLGRATTLLNAPPGQRDRSAPGTAPSGWAAAWRRCSARTTRTSRSSWWTTRPPTTGWPTWWPAAARPERTAFRCGASSRSDPGCPGRATPGCAPPPGGSSPTWTTTSTRTGTGWPSWPAGSRSAAGSSGSAGWCCRPCSTPPRSGCTSSSAGTARAAA